MAAFGLNCEENAMRVRFWIAVLASAMMAGTPMIAVAQTGGRGSYGLALGGGVISQKWHRKQHHCTRLWDRLRPKSFQARF
jgi:hypothetical protein